MRIFEGLDYVHKEGESHAIEVILGVLGEFVEQGKVGFVGLSNETPWGVMTFLKASETLGLPRIVSIQNAFNLVNRSFEIGLTEIFYREKVSLLGYSPLGQGYLSGKYEGGALPEGSRKLLFDRLGRYEIGNGPRATRPTLLSRGSMGSIRRKWRLPSQPRGPSLPRPSSARRLSISSRPISTVACSSSPMLCSRTSRSFTSPAPILAPKVDRECRDCFPE